jgi:16S rRNA processing protein RimM
LLAWSSSTLPSKLPESFLALTADDIVVLGRLTDPYGIQGWIKLRPYGDDPLAWAEMPTWWLGKEDGPWREVKLKGLKVHGDGVVMLLDGIPDRTAADALKGMLVGAPRDKLPATDDDEFYWGDLIGLVVRILQTKNSVQGGQSYRNRCQ